MEPVFVEAEGKLQGQCPGRQIVVLRRSFQFILSDRMQVLAVLEVGPGAELNTSDARNEGLCPP